MVTKPGRLSVFTVGGTVQAGEGLYVSRVADEELLAACHAGRYAYVLTARQMGKSSLMVRTAERLSDEGVRTAILDLTELGVQTTAREWYLGLMIRVASRLGIQADLLAWWREHSEVGVTQRLSLFFQEIVLPQVDRRIVIFIDEIDSTLSLDYTDDFFAALRYLYNARSTSEDLKRLSFVLIGVATPSDLIADPKRTPFNIGVRIDLTDFTAEEAAPFARGLPGVEPEQLKTLEEVLDWTGGHPYLTQRLCAEVAQRDGHSADVSAIVGDIFLGDNAQRDNNLHFVGDMVTKRAPAGQPIMSTYQQIRLGRRPMRDEEQSPIKAHLKLSGIVRRQGNHLVVRNRIYREVFDRQWIREQWPVHWWDLVPREVKLAGAISLILFVGLLLATWVAISQQRVAEQSAAELAAEVDARATAQGIAEEQRAVAEEEARISLARELAAEANANLGIDPELSILLALEAVNVTRSDDGTLLKEAEEALHRAVASNNIEKTLSNPFGFPNALAYSPDGNRLAAGYPLAARIAIWDPNTGVELSAIQVDFARNIDDLAFNHDGTKIAAALGGNLVGIWDVTTGEKLLELQDHRDRISEVLFSPDGQELATFCLDGITRIWDTLTGELLFSEPHYGSGGIAFSPDGAMLVTGGEDLTLAIWDIASAERVDSLAGGRLAVRQIMYSQNGEYIAAYQPDLVSVWEAESGRIVLTIPQASPGGVLVADLLDFGAGGDLLAIVESDGRIGVWDLASKIKIMSVACGQLPNFIAVSPDGKFVAAIDGKLDAVRICSLSAEYELLTVSVRNRQYGVDFSPDGRFLAMAGNDGTARVIEVDSGQEVRRVSKDGDRFSDVVFNSDGARFVTTSDLGISRVWDVETGDELITLPGHSDTVWGVAFTHDGKTIATASADGKVILWNADTGARTSQRNSIAGELFGVAFSPDGRLLAAASNGMVIVWDLDVAGILPVLILEKPSEDPKMTPASAWGVAFSHDGSQIAAVFNDGQIMVWDVEESLASRTGHELLSVNSGDPGLMSVSFNPDGTRIAAAGFGGKVQIRNVQTGEEILSLRGHTNTIWDLNFSPDGRYLASASWDGTVRVFVLQIDELITLAESKLTRWWTPEECRQYLRTETCPAEPGR